MMSEGYLCFDKSDSHHSKSTKTKMGNNAHGIVPHKSYAF